MKFEYVIDYYPGETGEFVRVDEEKCTGCGLCAKFCQRSVWIKDGEIYRPKNLKDCVECGACWNVCNFDAVIFEEPKGGTGVRFALG
jgi:MinD superfamily P-loop ATPase